MHLQAPISDKYVIKGGITDNLNMQNLTKGKKDRQLSGPAVRKLTTEGTRGGKNQCICVFHLLLIAEQKCWLVGWLFWV